MQLEAHHISKTYGVTRALREVSLTLQPGQVHALVGENGAGKSTLFKICAGAVRPDSGQMMLDGKSYTPRSLREAQNAGVALVFQEITVNPSLTIAENIYIDRLSQHAGLLGLSGWRALRRAAQSILDEIGAEIRVEQRLESLDLGQLKVIEIARALSYRPKILLLDESTAFLSTPEMEALFRVIGNLKQQGIAIGYISHHLEEIERLADTITILKDGTWVGTHPMGELTTAQIEARMVGREVMHEMFAKTQSSNGHKPLLTLHQVALTGKLEPLDLEIYSGEVLGIGGLKGSGGELLLSLLIGDQHVTQGQMTFENAPYRPRFPFESWEHGIAYLPGDRTGEGLIIDFSVGTNLSMAAKPQIGPFVDQAGERRLIDRLIPMLQIKAERSSIACSSLSGGNLQKVVLGKCIATQPKVLLLNNPTRGIDVGARQQIYTIIHDLVQQGMAVVLLSEDLPELIGLSHRLLVMRKGKVSKIFSYGETPSEEEVIRYMV